MRTLESSDSAWRGATWLRSALLCSLVGLSLLSGCATAKPSATLREDPKTAGDYYQRGVYFQNQSRPSEAIPEYTRAVALDEKYPDAYFMRSLCYILVDDYEAAVADLTQAIKLRPKQAGYFRLRATAYSYLEDPDNAIADYDAAIALNRNDYWLYLSKASLLVQESRFADAIGAYREFLAKSPNVATEVVSSLMVTGLFGVLADLGGNIRSARGIAPQREAVKEMIKLCERMLQPDGPPAAAHPIRPGMTEAEVLQTVMTTDRIVAENSVGSPERDLLVTISKTEPIEDRTLRVLVLDRGRLTLEKRVPLREVMELPGVSKFPTIPLNPAPPRNVVSELIRQTDHVLYEDDRQIVTVTEWETLKGKRIRFFNFDKDKLTSYTHGSRKLW